MAKVYVLLMIILIIMSGCNVCMSKGKKETESNPIPTVVHIMDEGYIWLGTWEGSRNAIPNYYEIGKVIREHYHGDLSQKLFVRKDIYMPEKTTYTASDVCSNCSQPKCFDIPKGIRIKEYFKDKEWVCNMCGCMNDGKPDMTDFDETKVD